MHASPTVPPAVATTDVAGAAVVAGAIVAGGGLAGGAVDGTVAGGRCVAATAGAVVGAELDGEVDGGVRLVPEFEVGDVAPPGGADDDGAESGRAVVVGASAARTSRTDNTDAGSSVS